MAKIRPHPDPENEITKGIEGVTVWDSKVLTYDFAEESQKDEVIFDLKNLLPLDKLKELYPEEEQDLSLSKFDGVFHSLEESNPTDALFIQDTRLALDAYARVADIFFTETANFTQADLKLAGIDDLKYQKEPDGVFKSVLEYLGITEPQFEIWEGKGSFPGTNYKFASLSDYESYVYLRTNSPALAQPKEAEAEDGAANFRSFAILHEFGHALGLAHPHDQGNGTTSWEAGQPEAGDDPLDNERYTVMSYETGGLDQKTWQESTIAYGHPVTPMAIDIAALQHMYGETELYSGNTTYRLTDPNSAKLDVAGEDGTVSIGRAFYCIWDTGGADTIAYDGSSRVLINLNDATLSRSTDDAGTQDWIKTLTGTVGGKAVYDSLPPELQNDLTKPEYHAGGFFSRVFSDSGAQLGGYSIAKGAQIENAVGGPDNDVLIGNEGNNELIGNSGKDLLLGAVGADTLVGRDGYDLLFGGDGNDLLIGGLGRDDQSGGADNDVYVYTSVEDSPADNINSDRIAFVGAGAAIGDRIDFAAIDADFGIAGNQSFSFLGTNAPYDGEAAAKIWVVGGSQDADTTVYASVDSDNTPELLIFAVDGVATAADWTSGDFLL